MVELAENGVTIRATHTRDFYEDNQIHTLNGVEYKVVLCKDELKEMIDNEEDVTKVVTTFITDMNCMF